MGVRAAAVIGTVYCVGVALVCHFAGEQLLGLFLDASANGEILLLARQYVRTTTLFFVSLLFVFILRLSVQGMGYTRLAMLAGAFEMAARTVVALYAVPRWGFGAACFANPAAWILADLFLFPCLVHCWRKKAGKLPLGKGGVPVLQGR